MSFNKHSIDELIKKVSPTKDAITSEYLGMYEGKHYYFQPTPLLKSYFVNRVGDKWNSTKAGMVADDLRRTSILFTGLYVSARGGLCPSGLRLVEVSNFLGEYSETLIEEFIKLKLKV